MTEYGHDEGCTVIGGNVYRGSVQTALIGGYVFGDYCTGEVWSAVVGDGSAAGVRQEPFRVPGLSSFGQDSRGELYAVSIDSGKVYKLVP